jgi:hypothetical protein
MGAMASVPLLYRSISESISWQARVLDWGPAPGMHCIEIQKIGKGGTLRDWILVWETGRGFHIATPEGVPKYLMHRLSALLAQRDAEAAAAAARAKAPIRRTSSSVREGHSGGGLPFDTFLRMELAEAFVGDPFRRRRRSQR